MTNTADIHNSESLAAGRRGAKSAGAFRTISEVATELDVPQHVLRFWESRFSQIRPLKRAGGRRYYRPEDVDLLRRIRGLLYQHGYTIKGVQKLLRDGGRASGEPAVADDVEAPPSNHTAPPIQPMPAATADATRSVIGQVIEELVELRDLLNARKG